jgi:hypothetical protein
VSPVRKPLMKAMPQAPPRDSERTSRAMSAVFLVALGLPRVKSYSELLLTLYTGFNS